jgi:outer membrane protein assembly factor BamB
MIEEATMEPIKRRRYQFLFFAIIIGLLSFIFMGCNGSGGDGGDEMDGGNQPPGAEFTADPTKGALPLMVFFDASVSFDPDGTIVSYDWDFGDGTSDSGNPISHEYIDTGTFTVTLVVTDNKGEESEASTTIEVNRTIWTFFVDKPVYYASPAIGEDGTIYFATGMLIHTSYGSLYAVSPEGTLKWKFDLDNNSDDGNIWTNDNNGASPAIAENGTVYLIDHRNVVYALNPDGTLKWKNNTYESDAMWHVGQKTPAIGADGTLYFCAGLTLYALDPVNGEAKWQLDNLRGGNVCAVSGVVGADGTIYIASNDMFYAVNPDGTQKWPSPFQLLHENEKSFSSPAIGADGMIYFGAEGTANPNLHEGYLYAVNPDGTEKWRFVVPGRRPVRASPALALDGTIYVTTKAYWDEGKKPALCLALNPDDGSLKWRYEIEPKEGIPVAQDSYTSPAVGLDSTIYFAAENNYIYALNPDGTLKWKEDTTNGINWSSPAIMSDGTLYIGGHHNTLEVEWAGKLMAIRTESYGLADSSWPKFRNDNSNTGRFSP